MITGQLKRIIEINSLQDEEAFSSKNICAVVSGKGGTGKTLISFSLSYLLAKRNYKILLVDLDLNLANIHYLLNQTVENSLLNYFRERCELKDIITQYSENLNIIFGLNSYSIKEISFKTGIENFLSDIKKKSIEYDFVIFDCGAGISELTLRALEMSDFKTIVALPEPTAIMDAYALIKVFEKYKSPSKFNIILNRCEDIEEGFDSYQKLSKAVSGFLKSSVELISTVRENHQVRKSLIEQSIADDLEYNEKFISDLLAAADKIDKYIHLTNINQPSKKALQNRAENTSKSKIIL